MATRQNYEKEIVDNLVAGMEGAGSKEKTYKGNASDNRFCPKDWGLTGKMRFQYGDFRVEMADRTLVVEIETAGNVSNLVKFWPLLTSDSLAKPLLLIHVFWTGSKSDYQSHILLWRFVRERMRQSAPDVFNGWLLNYRGKATDSALRGRFERCLRKPLAKLLAEDTCHP